MCAIASNTLGTTDKKCTTIRLDKTAPNIEGVGDLIVNKDVTVDLKSGVTYNDALSGLDGGLTITPSSVDTTSVGTKQVVYSIKDFAGNVREVVRNIIVDADAPNIVFSLTDNSVINGNGWANKDFYVRATITDNSGTGIKSASSCVSNTSGECTPTATFTGTTKNFLISTEGNNRVCVQVTDNNNKTTKVCSDTYNLDKTAPVAGTATFSGTLGNNGWYRSNVTVNKVNGTDGLSGHASTTSSISSITSNTSGRVITITTTDLAGNTSSRDYTVKIDKTAPTFSLTTDTSTWNQLGIAVNSPSDVGSGIDHYEYYIKYSTEADSAYELIYNGVNTSYTTSDVTGATYTVKVVAYDKAGNSYTQTGKATVIICFAEGTEVFTENGYKPIEDIQVGEKVWTINLESNELVLEKVIETFVNDSYEIMHVTIEDEVVNATPRHQFYVVDKGWVRAYYLEVGDKLMTDEGTVEITNVEYERLKEPIKVYNFTVENEHTYLVTKYSVLVHNAFTPSPEKPAPVL